MPLYMDIHTKVEGVTAEAVAGAHLLDLGVQGKYGSATSNTGWTRAAGRYSAWSMPPTRKLPSKSTARRMAWLQMRSTRSLNTRKRDNEL